MSEIIKICKVHGELTEDNSYKYYPKNRKKFYYRCRLCSNEYSKNNWIKIKSSKPVKEKGKEIIICKKHNFQKIYKYGTLKRRGSYICTSCRKDYVNKPGVRKRRNELEKIRRSENIEKYILKSRISKEKHKEKNREKVNARSRRIKKIQIETLPDSVVIDRIIYRTLLKRKWIPKDLINAKRIIIFLNKEIRRQKNELKQNTNSR